MKPLDVVLVGAGNRGYHVYGDYALRFPHKLRYVGVAEPDATRRRAFAEKFGIPPSGQFASWEELAGREPLGEAAFVVTMDRAHFGPSMALLRQGYHVIVEKPMAVDPFECAAMVAAARQCRRILAVGHVLRFTPFYREIAGLIRAGVIGEVVNITQTECVGFWHFAQSFVRMNFARAEDSAPSILAKCCHDLDIIRWLMGRPARQVASMGNLFEFRPERAPGKVPERCTDGCPYEAQCPYSAFKLYIEPTRGWLKASFRMRCGEADPIEYLKSAPQSKCVYLGANNVCDQQVVLMEFEGGATATLTMQAHTQEDTRVLRIHGTRGEIQGHLVGNDIQVCEFNSGKRTRITPEKIESGHLGGDVLLIDQFIENVRNGAGEHLASAAESLESHLLAFAAEQARLERRVVDMAAFTAALRIPGGACPPGA